MKLLLLIIFTTLTGCATVFDTPVPKYDISSISCSPKDLTALQDFVGKCKQKGYSDMVCFDYGVYRHCGDKSDIRHKFKTDEIVY